MKIEEGSENLLARVTLRLMEESERERFDQRAECKLAPVFFPSGE